MSPQPARRIAKSDRTRAAILNAALDFLWSRPFREMTVTSLMSSTSVSRSAFYQYFNDLHEVMETLLDLMQDEILDAAQPWLAGVGDPVALLHETLGGVVRVCYRRGPFLRAISEFLRGFDDAACDRMEADQKQGLIPKFDVRPVAFALTRLDAYTLIHAFGQRPRSRPEPVREALVRIWISTLYGAEWVGKGSSNLIRR